MGNSAYPRVEKDKSYSYKINRCTKPRKYPKNIRKLGRNGKEVTDINVKHKTPVVAMRDMQFFFAKDYSAENRCKEHKDQKIGEINITLPDPLDPKKKRKCITPYDMITIAFKDTLTGDVILYTGLSSTPLVPGFDGKQGYGGACFPKDTFAFSQFSDKLTLLKKAIEINNDYRSQYERDDREKEQNIQFNHVQND